MGIHLKVILTVSVCAAFVIGGFFGAINISQGALNLSDSASISQSNTFSGLQNRFPKGVFIGQQGSGGVTYFNGSIANLTTNDDGDDNPVTFGDNVRIDGEIWRGANPGPGDNQPIKLNDDVKFYGGVEGLSIDNDSIASDAGIDISKVNNLQSSLDSKASTTQQGIAKAAFFYSSSGIARSFGTTISVWNVQTGAQIHTLDFTLTDKYFTVSPTTQAARHCVAGVWGSNNSALEVRCYNDSGALTETDYMVTIF